MVIRSINRPWFVLLAVALLVAAAPIAVGTAQTDDGEAEAEKILQERLVVLAEIVRFEEDAFKNGKASFTSVLAAQSEYLQAALEMTNDPRKRVEILREHFAVAEQMEKTVEQLVQAGEASRVDLLKARAARLKAQADLISAQRKIMPKP